MSINIWIDNLTNFFTLSTKKLFAIFFMQLLLNFTPFGKFFIFMPIGIYAIWDEIGKTNLFIKKYSIWNRARFSLLFWYSEKSVEKREINSKKLQQRWMKTDEKPMLLKSQCYFVNFVGLKFRHFEQNWEKQKKTLKLKKRFERWSMYRYRSILSFMTIKFGIRKQQANPKMIFFSLVHLELYYCSFHFYYWYNFTFCRFIT